LPAATEAVRRVAGEVTRLNYEGQFKPFVYLNVTGTGADLSQGPERSRHGQEKSQEEWPGKIVKKNPATRRDFPALTRFELAIPWRVLALTARILLLLAGLLSAALLLTGLLARVLVLLAWVLLARVRILVRHRNLPC
jgi:hypothetical protein